MTVTWIINGKLQLILTPSDDREKNMLAELGQGPVEMQIFPKIQTGTDSHNDAAVITAKKS